MQQYVAKACITDAVYSRSHTHVCCFILGTHVFANTGHTADLCTQGYAMGKKLVYAATGTDDTRTLSIPELAVAGAFSAIPMAFVAAPVERVKVVMQIDGQRPTPQYKGPIDVISKLYKEGGAKSLFRGTGATIARDAPGSAA